MDWTTATVRPLIEVQTSEYMTMNKQPNYKTYLVAQVKVICVVVTILDQQGQHALLGQQKPLIKHMIHKTIHIVSKIIQILLKMLFIIDLLGQLWSILQIKDKNTSVLEDHKLQVMRIKQHSNFIINTIPKVGDIMDQLKITLMLRK